ncbi:MAG TPA: DUF5671 domain-containing protein [Candidatus Paceibacterota bacterium]|jgi:hypothetical protein
MEQAPTRTTPRDFFLWAGAVIALYGSVLSLITLLFEYVNHAFPDPLAYWGDPYGGAVRAAMAGVIVLVPTTIILLRIIRGSITKEPGKANIWVRRWALVLTVFIAIAVILIDLITLITTFLGGELSVRFGLKVAIVLLVALGVFLHFLADLKGYWAAHPKKADLVGIGAGILALVAVVAGFFVIGTPSTIRELRYDEQRVSDLQSIQYQIVNFWQLKEALPADIAELNDPLSGFMVPVDPDSGAPYRYVRTSDSSFELCATFSQETPETKGQGSFPRGDVSYPSMMPNENWQHGAGEVCFSRTIDPERYPPFGKPVR